MHNLIKEIEKYNLVLDYYKEYSPNNSNGRILSVLKKYDYQYELNNKDGT